MRPSGRCAQILSGTLPTLVCSFLSSLANFLLTTFTQQKIAALEDTVWNLGTELADLQQKAEGKEKSLNVTIKSLRTSLAAHSTNSSVCTANQIGTSLTNFWLSMFVRQKNSKSPEDCSRAPCRACQLPTGSQRKRGQPKRDCQVTECRPSHPEH